MSYLTERQQDVLSFIRDRIESSGMAPTLQEIADAFAFRSTASAQKHIALLQKKGFLRREKHQKRGLVLVDASASSPVQAHELPLLGVVAAGSPIESLAGDESISVPPNLLRSGEHFVLRVRGDSMIDDGIHDGDLVVIQRVVEPREGDTVVALVESEVTLKRYFPQEDGTIRLQPANPTVRPIVAPAGNVRVQGVVVGLVRQY